jgi:hypothetical protein
VVRETGIMHDSFKGDQGTIHRISEIVLKNVMRKRIKPLKKTLDECPGLFTIQMVVSLTHFESF